MVIYHDQTGTSTRGVLKDIFHFNAEYLHDPLFHLFNSDSSEFALLCGF